MDGPTHCGTYMKGESFDGLLFAKFKSGLDRDTAFALFRTAKLKLDDTKIWATQNLPVPTRARNLFLLGLKRWQLGQWGFVKKNDCSG